MRHFEYVGPPIIRAQAREAAPGAPIPSLEALRSWFEQIGDDLFDEGGWATYVVDLSGRLVVAPRRTEHVACAGGNPVLAAGEIRFSRTGRVLEVTNHSTGYCPAEDCWESVAAALDAAQLVHPSSFSFVARFRFCPGCGERNLVKEDWYQCAFCDADLPTTWNAPAR